MQLVGWRTHIHRGQTCVSIASIWLSSSSAFTPARTVAPQGHAEVRPEVLELDVVAKVDNVLALLPRLYEHFGLSHDLYDLSDVAAWFLEELQLLAQQAHAGIEVVPLCLEAPQVLRLAVDGVLCDLNLGLEEVLCGVEVVRTSSMPCVRAWVGMLYALPCVRHPPRALWTL